MSCRFVDFFLKSICILLVPQIGLDISLGISCSIIFNPVIVNDSVQFDKHADLSISSYKELCCIHI